LKGEIATTLLLSQVRKGAEMANRLKMVDIQAILALKRRKWSNRRIAAELGIDRETVGRYVQLEAQGELPATLVGPAAGSASPNTAKAPSGKESELEALTDGTVADAGRSASLGSEAKPAVAPTGVEASAGEAGQSPAGESAPAPPGEHSSFVGSSSNPFRTSESAPALPGNRGEITSPMALAEGGREPNPAKAPAGKSTAPRPASSGRPSDCEEYREPIMALLEQGLSAQRIYQDLAADGFAGSYFSVRRFTHRLREERPEAYRRMECAPGEEAQVDFGSGAPIVQGGKRRRPHVFRIVLSHSRKGYSEASYRQTTEDFLRCLENAFWHFGGVPRTLVIDNLKAAVVRCDWFDPDLHPKLLSFCQHYGTIILPTKPYMPRHKGKVESGASTTSKAMGSKGTSSGRWKRRTATS
jgi:transposase